MSNTQSMKILHPVSLLFLMLGAALFCFFATGFMLTGSVRSEADSSQVVSGWYVQQSNTYSNLESVDAADKNTAWAVGSAGTILKTIDGGSTWKPQSPHPDYQKYWFESVCAIDGNTAWVVGQNCILRTDDGGKNWIPQESGVVEGHLLSISAANKEVAWAVGTYGTIIRTTDGGKTWVKQNSGWYKPHSQIFDVHAVSENTAWACGYEGMTGSGIPIILKTTNGGDNWIKIPPRVGCDDRVFISVYAIDSEVAWLSGQMMDPLGSILKTEDGGRTWNMQSSDFWGHGMDGVKDKPLWVVCNGINDTFIQKSMDGETWHRQTAGIKDWLRDIAAADENTAWAVGDNGIILHTKDGGGSIPISTWYFAEGCTREGFQEWICLQNPNPADMEIYVKYLLFSASPIERIYTIPACSRITISANAEVGPGHDLSATLWSYDGEFYAERAMYFNYKMGLRGYSWDDGHVAVGARAPRSDWYFAEGCTRSGFETWLCIQNPSNTDTTAIIDYTSAGAYTLRKEYTVPANSRISVFVNGDMGPEQDVSTYVHSRIPIVVERPMYFNYRAIYNTGYWPGGHVVMGTSIPRKEWYFAEGCTRPGFEEWICILNPNPSPASLQITYATNQGPVEKNYEIPANSRGTLSINAEVGMNRDVSCHILSDQSIICERPIYFSYSGYGAPFWSGGSNEVGITAPKTDWYFAEGCTNDDFHDWICIQNPGEEATTVKVAYNIAGTTPLTKTHLVPPGRYTIFVNLDAGPGLDLSAHLASDDPIIAERSMYFDYNGWKGGHCAAGYAP